MEKGIMNEIELKAKVIDLIGEEPHSEEDLTELLYIGNDYLHGGKVGLKLIENQPGMFTDINKEVFISSREKQISVGEQLLKHADSELNKLNRA